MATSMCNLHDDGVSVRQSKDTSVFAGAAGDRSAISARRRSRPKPKMQAPGQRFQRDGSGAIELDRAAEQIEEWLLEVARGPAGHGPDGCARDRPFAEFGVDSLTAVELSQELEDEFGVPLPAVVAWNYPTPAALARTWPSRRRASIARIRPHHRNLRRMVRPRPGNQTTSNSRRCWLRLRTFLMKRRIGFLQMSIVAIDVI